MAAPGWSRSLLSLRENCPLKSSAVQFYRVSQKPPFFPKAEQPTGKACFTQQSFSNQCSLHGIMEDSNEIYPERRNCIGIFSLSPNQQRLLGGFMLQYKTGWRVFYSSEWMAFLFGFNGRRVTDFCPSGCQRGLCGPHLLHGYLITHSWTDLCCLGFKKWRTLIFLTVGREQLNSNWFLRRVNMKGQISLETALDV